jgi:hypothetical protein
LTTVENMAVSSEPTSDPLAYLDQLTATVEELGRSRWMLRQVISLANDAPGLTDAQLRDRLVALADRARLAQRSLALTVQDPGSITLPH